MFEVKVIFVLSYAHLSANAPRKTAVPNIEYIIESHASKTDDTIRALEIYGTTIRVSVQNYRRFAVGVINMLLADDPTHERAAMGTRWSAQPDPPHKQTTPSSCICWLIGHARVHPTPVRTPKSDVEPTNCCLRRRRCPSSKLLRFANTHKYAHTHTRTNKPRRHVLRAASAGAAAAAANSSPWCT